MLAACTDAAKPAESLPDSSELPVSSSITLSPTEQALEDIVKKLAMPKIKMAIDINNDTVSEMIFADGGYVDVTEPEDVSGFVKNSQAWFAMHVESNAVVLDGAVSLDKSEAPFPTPKMFADLGKDIYTVDASNPRKFSSKDEGLLGSAGVFVGLDDAVDTAAVLVSNQEITFGFTYGSYKIYYTFSEFGTASNAALDAFLASPKDKLAPTAFSASELADLAVVMGEDASKRPFPSFATAYFGASYSLTYQDFDMTDLSAGKAGLASYSSQLTAAGFTPDSENTETSAYFTLPISAEREDLYVVHVYFLDAAKDLEGNPAYPNGILEVDVYAWQASSSSGDATLEGVVSAYNAALAAEGYNFELEWYEGMGAYGLLVNFGPQTVSDSALQNALLTLVSFLPDTVQDLSASVVTPSAVGAEDDFVGDGSKYGSYMGMTEEYVVVLAYSYFDEGNLMAQIVIYQYED